jgi:RimJ/RimL family protein N-acetyltransferase
MKRSRAASRSLHEDAVDGVAPLRTKRLLLEHVTRRSAAVLWGLRQSAHLRRYQDIPRDTRAEFERRVAARPVRLDGRAAGRFDWLIREVESGVPMGWVSLRVGEDARGFAELSYGMLAEYRGAGYASEAAQAVIELAFVRAANLRLIGACCLSANEPSRRLLAGSGFTGPRLEPAGAVVRGRVVDVLVFELTRERWLALRSHAAGNRLESAWAQPCAPLLRTRASRRAGLRAFRSPADGASAGTGGAGPQR